jgi:hypothetical protein
LQASHEYEKDCMRYLLGEMSEPEQTQFEEAYFADDSLFERFLVVKDELVDSHARGDLRGPQRERFETHFLSSEPRRQRIAEAETLIQVATAAFAKQNADEAVGDPWWRSISRGLGLPPLAFQAGLAILLLVVLAGSWLLIRNVRRQNADRERQQNEELARRRKEAEGAPANKLPESEDRTAQTTPTPVPTKVPNGDNINREAGRTVPAQIASIALLPFSARDSGTSNTLVLRSDTRAVAVHLAFKKAGHRRYDASLRSVDGKQVLSRRGLKISAGAEARVSLTFPASLLQGQDYIVTLTGLSATGEAETIGEYYFRVERRERQ